VKLGQRDEVDMANNQFLLGFVVCILILLFSYSLGVHYEFRSPVSSA